MRIKGSIFATLAAIAVVYAVTAYDSGTNKSGTAEFDQNIRTKEDCLGWGSKHLAQCSSPSCTNLVMVRLPKCFDHADGDKRLFCESVEKQFWGDMDPEFFATHCEPHDAAEYDCKKVVNVAVNYCVGKG